MWFAIDTLEFLKRGGRIGAASAWIGSTLKVKPILTVESEMTPVERVRTSARAFERLVDYARQRHESGADGWVRPAHLRARGRPSELIERCREMFGCEPMFVSEIGPVLSAAHRAGPAGRGLGPAHCVQLDRRTAQERPGAAANRARERCDRPERSSAPC